MQKKTKKNKKNKKKIGAGTTMVATLKFLKINNKLIVTSSRSNGKRK